MARVRTAWHSKGKSILTEMEKVKYTPVVCRHMDSLNWEKGEEMQRSENC